MTFAEIKGWHLTYQAPQVPLIDFYMGGIVSCKVDNLIILVFFFFVDSVLSLYIYIHAFGESW